ncbi:Uncharacterised protein [Weissella viridescens]|uniref:Uncharacterized protein n=1 Tax=Weissella viridescens TaxID=1629 RepID=A0A380P7F4_WEIVI|nr:Uncharacterised protein [Weissella viridescens]
MDKPELLYEFGKRGALAQVTASSYVGVLVKKYKHLHKTLLIMDWPNSWLQMLTTWKTEIT